MSHLYIFVSEPRLIEFPIGGRPGASSYADHDTLARNAFELGRYWESNPWIRGGAPLPQTVWYRFPEAVTVSEFSFSSGDDWLEYMPRKFDFVGSDDCAAWTTIQSYETEFTRDEETKEFAIPAAKRKSFRCVGIRVTKTKSNTFAAIQHMNMWSYN